jgi:beta-lactamase regulating signal transducer with metallopeptidase domain
MNFFIETLNQLGDRAFEFAWSMLWQSGLLVAILVVFELTCGRRVRPAVRYALWLLVLLKLIMPPTLALPSGIGWWGRSPAPSPHIARASTLVVRYGSSAMSAEPREQTTSSAPESVPAISVRGWILLVWAWGSMLLLGWMLTCWRRAAQMRELAAATPDWLDELLVQASRAGGLKKPVRAVLVDQAVSPAVYGIIHPVILIPRLLVSDLSRVQLRSAVLHEVVHVRRGDVWVHFFQALIQIIYWWHPLLWLANGRIRLAREEAVDDAVVDGLQGDAGAYPSMLLQVGRLVLGRSVPTLGLVGILETRSALRRRIERLLDQRVPRRTGLTLGSTLCVLAFGALALPMGQAPGPVESLAAKAAADHSIWPDERFPGYSEIKLEARFFSIDEASLRSLLPAVFETTMPVVFASNLVAEVNRRLIQANARPNAPGGQVSFGKFSGGKFSWQVGDCTNNAVNYLTKDVGERTIVIGANSQIAATDAEWVPLNLIVQPWSIEGGVKCQMNLVAATTPHYEREAEATIAVGGAILWAFLVEPGSRRYELVMLSEGDARLDDSPITAVSSVTNANDSHALGFDWYLGNSLMANGKVGFSGGTVPSYSGDSSNISRLGVWGGEWSLRAHTNGATSEANRPRAQDGISITNHAVLPTSGRQRVVAKLQSIRLKSVEFDDVPLGQVVKFLSDASEKLDPEKRGIKVTRDSRATEIDNTPIRIRPSLVDVRLSDVIDAVTKVSRVPLKYSIEDDGVIFSARKTEPIPLYTRIIKVDPQTLSAAIIDALGRGKTNEVSSKQIRDFLGTLGVDLRPPKNLFYNDREGTLLVRASLSDLDTLETAIMFLQTSSRQEVNIRAKFIWLPEPAAKAFWTRFPSTNHFADGTLTSYLTASQATDQLDRWKTELDQNSSIQSMSVTTLSGRQVECQIADLTNVVFPASSGAERGSTNSLSTAPTLDLTPFVGTEGTAVQMVLCAYMTEFLGYDDPGQFEPLAAVTIIGRSFEPKPIDAEAPIPRFRILRLPSNVSKLAAVANSGETVVLGGFKKQATADQVPIFGGDKPILGRLFQATQSSSPKGELVLFITPTVLNGSTK